MKKVFVIAEAGVNHNGDFILAKELIDIAASSGADAIKFQTFVAKMVMTRTAVKANYQLNTAKNSQTQFDMVKKLELPFEWHYDLLDYCKTKKIKFLSTAFDQYSLDFLADEILLDILKIPIHILPKVKDCSDDFGHTDPKITGESYSITGMKISIQCYLK